MKIQYRIGYYLGGFAIGLVILFFFLGGKRASCDYSPNARTLKNIRTKEMIIPQKVVDELHAFDLDTNSVSSLLDRGNVLFSESNTKLDSCRQYVIEGNVSDKRLKIRVENCDKKATILNSTIMQN